MDKTKSKDNAYSFLFLAIGSVLLLFSNGRWVLPIATWFSFVFLLRFSRTQKPVIGFLFIFLVNSVASIIVWKGMIPLQGGIYYIFMIIGGLFVAFLFFVDRIIAPRIHGFLSTFVFPLAFVALEYIRVLNHPYGSNGSIAHTQSHLPLLQIVSVTGLWGIVFLITWFASVVNWAWERKFDYPKIRFGLGIYLGIMMIVFFYGSGRLSLFPPDSKTVRVASVFRTGYSTDIPDKGEKWEQFREESAQELETVLELSRDAGNLGAKIIIWHEGSIYLLKQDESMFVEKACEFARKENLYLGMSILSLQTDFPDSLAENKIVWIDTKGTVLFEYLKAIPTPTEPCIAGDGRVQTFHSPWGIIASTICFDMDFPGYIRKFGKANIDIMITPANDWKEISPFHAYQVSMRAIEQGFSMVRPCGGGGFSAAFDYQGRLLSGIDKLKTDQKIMISDVPTKGVITVYSRIGDVFAWLNIFVFVVVLIVLFKKLRY